MQIHLHLVCGLLLPLVAAACTKEKAESLHDRVEEVEAPEMKPVMASASETVVMNSAKLEGAPAALDDGLNSTAWNFWAEAGKPKSQPSFTPVATVKPGESFHAVLDLAGVSYAGDDVPTQTDLPSGAFREEIHRLLEDDPNRHQATFEFFIFPDPTHFSLSKKPVIRVSMQIDLDRFRSLKPEASDGGRFAKFQTEPLPPFVFGRVQFPLSVNSRQGSAPLAISVWSEGRPIDELFFSVCVAASPGTAACSTAKPETAGLSGLDSIRAAAGAGGRPDMAIHFLQVAPGTPMVGVMALRSKRDKYFIWTLEHEPDDLRAFFTNTLPTTLDNAIAEGSDDDLASAGSGLYEMLFPRPLSGQPEEEQLERKSARAEFSAFARAPLPTDGGTPSIFVRLVPTGADPPLVIPFGLIRIPDVEPAEYVGFKFRVLLPMAAQSYQRASSCIANWTLAYPEVPADDEMRDALSQSGPMIDWADGGARQLGTIRALSDWLSSPADPTAPEGVMIIAHHGNGNLTFDSSSHVMPPQVVRRFVEPSVLVLNGCGTNSALPINFVDEFNKNGVSATIVTQASIKGRMAGQFENCFTSAIADADAGFILLADAYSKALGCLREKPTLSGAPNGPRALAYSLLGNPDVPLCPPSRSSP